jgi:hypothetical protein
MGKIKLYTGNVLIALFLLTVLTGSIVIKPAHILFVHHEHSEIIQNCFPQKVLSILHTHDCSICDFEFCSFIPQKQVTVPQVNILCLKEPVIQTVSSFVTNSSINFLLRAPPVF